MIVWFSLIDDDGDVLGYDADSPYAELQASSATEWVVEYLEAARDVLAHAEDPTATTEVEVMLGQAKALVGYLDTARYADDDAGAIGAMMQLDWMLEAVENITALAVNYDNDGGICTITLADQWWVRTALPEELESGQVTADRNGEPTATWY